MGPGIFRTRAKAFRRDGGQSAFEFVLMLPFFILFLLLLVDLGILMYEYVSVSNAVREGARYASVNCPLAPNPGCQGATEVRDRVVQRSGGILSTADAYEVSWVDTLAPAGNHDRGDTTVVRVTHTYDFLFLPFTIPVVSCANMQLELQDPGAIPATTITGC